MRTQSFICYCSLNEEVAVLFSAKIDDFFFAACFGGEMVYLCHQKQLTPIEYRGTANQAPQQSGLGQDFVQLQYQMDSLDAGKIPSQYQLDRIQQQC